MASRLENFETLRDRPQPHAVGQLCPQLIEALVGMCARLRVACRVSPGRATHFLLLRQEKVSKEKASRSQSRCAVRCAARSGRGRSKLGFASNNARPDPPAAALLSSARTAWSPDCQGQTAGSPCLSGFVALLVQEMLLLLRHLYIYGRTIDRPRCKIGPSRS